MAKHSLAEKLSNNTYPGRGIVAGLTPNGASAVAAYFIMGRSENSRNRIFAPSNGGIVTEAADPAKLSDPSLIIYAPVRVYNDIHIVTNGDQTDTIYDGFTSGKDFVQSLRTRTFEPDAPNYTPRISAALNLCGDDFSIDMSILKTDSGNPDCSVRMFFEYAHPLAGNGYFIHTYDKDGDPIPSFSGEPVSVDTLNDIDDFTNLLWENLNNENKVSLFVRYIDIKTKKVNDRIVNKYVKTTSK